MTKREEKKRIRWEIVRYESFTDSILKLSPKQRWIVNTHIDNMRYLKSIKEFFKVSNCPHLNIKNIENYYVIDMVGDGIGHNEIQLIIYQDSSKKIIYPIYCRKYKNKPIT